MTNAAIEAVFGPAPSDVDLASDSRPGNDAAVIILLVIALIAVVLRIVSRKVAQAGVKADDYVMLVALVLCGSTTGMTIAGGVYGAGTHVWTLTIPDVTMIYKILFSYTFLYAAAVSSTKLSILSFYYRIFGRSAGVFFEVCLAFGSFLALSYPIIIWTTMSKSCQPLPYFWEQFAGATGTCIDIDTFFLALGIINMINDIVVLAIPIPQIMKLQMNRQRQVAVIGIMGLGGFVCVASIVRIHYLSVFMGATDVTFAMGPVFIWSSVEPCVGILSACLPTFMPLIKLVHRNLSTNGSGTETSQHSQLKTISSKGGMSWMRRREIDDTQFVPISEDEYQLTNYVAVGGTPLDTSFKGNGILVRSQVDQQFSSARG